MKVNRVLLYTLPVIGILLAGSFLIYNFTRKRPEKVDLVSDLSKLKDELKKTEDEWARGVEEMQKDLADKAREEHKKTMDELDKQQKEQIQSFEKHFKARYTEIPSVDFILDVSLPVTTPTKYQSGSHIVSLSKTTFTRDPELVDYTHTLEGQNFEVGSLQFCGKKYKVPKIKTNMITSIAFKNDPGFCYFLLVPGPASSPTFFKNNGTDFEICYKYPNIKQEMLELGVKFGRITQPTPTPETTPVTKPAFEPITPAVAPEPSKTVPPTSAFVFNLTINNSFTIGTEQVKLTISSEFGNKYKAYKYFVTDGKINPTMFTIGNNTQSGLPVNEGFDSITVYFHNEPLATNDIPLLVSFNQGSKNFLNSGDNNWHESETSFFEEELDYVNSKLNNIVSLNLSRRSDYYRNGSGSSNVEKSKDMNVYVETDKPVLSWSTYTHKLEDGGQGGPVRGFYIGKLLFGDREFRIKPQGQIESVDVYGKNFEPFANAPTVFSVNYTNGDQEYYVFTYSEYLVDKNINSSNLEQKLQSI
ncbi:uncharacterized protein TA17450 [Theileria annulata]|uniref:Uncharacterized protein n=1 Tax=Theileria annulata TaxID=5874 RepID=Q4UAV6_THEAN|nr:uncharacterized protein TA17450 [Theileria annulata]CAI76045.1 hypothetical protein TA17450 [Theileria annulata]|eukprot:XP_955521.1 hypothetical protein TA17450 [Theileria annulata]